MSFIINLAIVAVVSYFCHSQNPVEDGSNMIVSHALRLVAFPVWGSVWIGISFYLLPKNWRLI
jgi:hypothetical protein